MRTRRMLQKVRKETLFKDALEFRQRHVQAVNALGQVLQQIGGEIVVTEVTRLAYSPASHIKVEEVPGGTRLTMVPPSPAPSTLDTPTMQTPPQVPLNG